MKRPIFSFDMSLFFLMILLVSIGIVALYSVGYNKIEYSHLYLKQFLWFGIGLCIMLLIFSINITTINAFSTLIYFIVLIMLGLTLVFGKTIRGTKGWIVAGPVHFQFSELAKISTILMLARYLEYHFKELDKFKDLIIPFIIVLAPVFFILMQPDVGSTLIFLPVLIVLLFLAGASIRNIFYLIIVGALSIGLPLLLSYYQLKGELLNKLWLNTILSPSFVLSVSIILFFAWGILKMVYKFYPKYILLNRAATIIFIIIISLVFSFVITNSLKGYHKKRILVFIEPQIDPYGTGYNIVQSKIAIGSGRLAGKGFLKGSQTQLGFLPEQTTDFVVTVIGEEFGWLGISFVLLLYFLFILQGLKITYTAKDVYSALVAAGITSTFGFAVFINIGMNLGIMPVTGLPVPFLSYGGSSLVTCMIATALLINIKSERFL